MRRRVKEAGADAPPLPLTRYRGSTTREALAWIRDRDEWWTANRDSDNPGWLPWLLDGWEQVGVLPWCGSIGAPCTDPDCLCTAWPEHEMAHPRPQPRTTERHDMTTQPDNHPDEAADVERDDAAPTPEPQPEPVYRAGCFGRFGYGA